MKKFNFIRLIYGILIIIIFFSAFFPYFSQTSVYPPPPEVPIHINTRSYVGYIALIFGGWVGIALAIVSIILLNPERKKKSSPIRWNRISFNNSKPDDLPFYNLINHFNSYNF